MCKGYLLLARIANQSAVPTQLIGVMCVMYIMCIMLPVVRLHFHEAAAVQLKHAAAAAAAAAAAVVTGASPCLRRSYLHQSFHVLEWKLDHRQG